MTYTLDQLRGLVAVAEELHFGRAAARLRMTQPPLSRQIQKLEAAIGVQLLDRANRRVALTPAGEAFLREARRILAIAEAAPDLAQRVSSGFHGLVRIGFTAGSTFGILGKLLNELERELPEVRIELSEMVGQKTLLRTDAFPDHPLDGAVSEITPMGDSAAKTYRIRIALPEPEEYAAVPSEALEVGMPLGAILAVVIEGMHDAERLESRLVKGNRSIEILDGYKDVVEHGFSSYVSAR